MDATPEVHLERYLQASRKFEPHVSEEERKLQAARAMSDSMSTPDNVQRTTQIVQQHYRQQTRSGCGIYCMGTNRDDILMWSHYADSHRGICLEFDGAAKLMQHAMQVHYSEYREPINLYTDDEEAKLRKGLLTKSKHWEYEREWRLLRYESGPGVVKFRPDNLTGIILGAEAGTDTVQLVRAWISKRDAPLKLFQASVSSTKFELEIANA